MGNDIGTSQDFTPGQLNVSDVELDNIIGASFIKTSFYTAKPSAGASPSKANFKLLLLDNTVPAAPAFKLATLAEAVFDSDEFAVNRTAKAAPISADKVIIGDSAASGATKNTTVGGILFGGTEIGTLAQDDIFPIQDTSTGLKQYLSIAGLTFKLPARATAVLDTDVVAIGNTGGTATEKATLLQLASFITPAGIIMPFAGAATPRVGWNAPGQPSAGRPTQRYLLPSGRLGEPATVRPRSTCRTCADAPPSAPEPELGRQPSPPTTPRSNSRSRLIRFCRLGRR